MSAIKPSFNIPSLDPEMEEIREESQGATDEEKRFYSLSKNEGWKAFRELAERVIRELDEVNTQAIESGATFEEIGKNTLVITMTKSIINKLLLKVDDAVEAVETNEK